MTASRTVHRMQKVRVNGVYLEYELRGDGEPVLLIHGSHICGSFVPLLAQPALTDHYQLIRYHRRGFGNSTPPKGRFTIAQQADDARALLDRLGVGPAHVVGHSYGGAIALQMAHDFPESVWSLTLMEAALLTVEGGQEVRDLVAVTSDLYRAGGWEAAADLFLGSPKERADISRNVPGGLDEALRDVDTYFTVEAPAHEEWRFEDEHGSKIACPILFVLGSDSSQLYRNAEAQVRAWAPQTETETLRGASHLLHIQQPQAAAEILAEFFHRHPVKQPQRPMVHGRTRPGHELKSYNATVDILERNLEHGRADKVAIRTPDGDWTYAELCEQTNRAGNALADLGVEIENRVFMVMADSREFASCFFGAIKIGAVPVPVNTDLDADSYAYLLKETRAKVAVVSGSAVSQVWAAASQASHLRHLVVDGPGHEGNPSYQDLVACSSPELSAAETSRDDIAFWLYSLSETGTPKAAMHYHRAMRAVVNSYGRDVLGLTEDDTTFSVARLHLAYGLGGGLYLPIAAGSTTVLAREPHQTRMVLHTLRTYQPTVMFGVPTSYAHLLDNPRFRKGDEFDNVRLLVSAGEPLGERLLDLWRAEIGVDIVEGIGSTESCHIFISNRAGEVYPGSTGRLVEGYRARIVDDLGTEVAVGQPGRLWVTGDSLMAGYWKQPAVTRRALYGEWLDTGDIYVVDERGVFTFQGRLDDMMKVSGMWVSPLEVEAAMYATGLVTDCAAVGVHDAINLVRLVALVVPYEGSDLVEVDASLRREVRRVLGGNKTPRTIKFVKKLPRSENGDLLRDALLALARSDEAVCVDRGTRA
jgi:benzoate-CoA ligase family protein